MRRSIHLRRARAARRVKEASKKRRPRRPVVTKKMFRKAMEDSGGIIEVIARRLGCCRATVQNLLKRDGWERMAERYQHEVEKVADLSEETIKYAIEQRRDLSEATKNARWFLSRRRSGKFGDRSKMILEGGENPLRIKNETVSIDDLPLSIETKRALLTAIEEHEGEGKQV